MKTIVFAWIVYLIFGVLVIVGEVRCIVKAIECNWSPVGKAEVIYTVSACSGMGAFVGWMDIEDN